MRHQLSGEAELLHGGDMGEGCLRTEKGHLHRLFQGERSGDDLAEHPAHRLVGERPGIGRDQVAA